MAVLRLSSMALIASLALPASAAPLAPILTAELRCQRAAGPGRILCELNARATSGRLVWSDALVVRAPAFARPLRSRFVAQLDSSGAPSASAKLALVASTAGEGELELLARGVVCSEGASGEWCAPTVVPVTALIAVASAGPVGP